MIDSTASHLGLGADLRASSDNSKCNLLKLDGQFAPKANMARSGEKKPG